jgi:hypothetical protein
MSAVAARGLDRLARRQTSRSAPQWFPEITGRDGKIVVTTSAKMFVPQTRVISPNLRRWQADSLFCA